MKFIRPTTVILSFIGVFSAGCVVPRVGPVPPPAELLPADSRALRFGARAPDVLAHPELQARMRMLFGPDWTASAGSGAGTMTPAADFFGQTRAMRVVRVGDRTYTAVAGCLPRACRTHRGLLLIGEDGKELRARVDEGGVTHYYGFGTGVVMDQAERAFVESAWSVVETAGER